MRKDGTYLIRDVELLEASVVSIPANPRSWIQNAVKAAKAKRKEIPGITSSTTTNSSIGSWTFKVTDADLDTSIDPDESEDMGPEITEAATCPDCGGTASKPKGNCGNAMHKAIEPEIHESTTVLDLIKEEDGDAEPPVEAQEAPDSTSEPENADGDAADEADESGDGDDDAPEAEAVSEALGDLSVKSFTDVVELLRSTTSELLMTKAQMMRATAERDLAAKGFFAAMEVVQKVGDLPLARRARTPFNEAQASASRLRAIYSEQFMEILEKKTDE
jgi:hypothetical protein